ncbi:MAG TPA: hypothetical protein VF268_01155 [Gammaproteobacteria bacterium]
MPCRFLAFILITFLTMEGCVSSEVKEEPPPVTKRYAVMVRGMQSIIFSLDGLIETSGIRHSVHIGNTMPELFGEAIVSALKVRQEYVYVPLETNLKYELPAFVIGRGGIPAAARDAAEFHVQEERLIPVLENLANENNLDFIVIAEEWAATDTVHATDKMVAGVGVRFHTYLGWRRITARLPYRIRIFNPIKSSFSYWAGVERKRVEGLQWLDLHTNAPPDDVEVARFIPHIESMIPPTDLNAVLCMLNLIPAPSGADGLNGMMKCMNGYPKSTDGL